VFVNNYHNVSDALVHLNGTFGQHHNRAAQLHCNQQNINNDQQNMNKQVESHIYDLGAGRENYKAQPLQPQEQLHKHADCETCLFRHGNDNLRDQFTKFLASEESKQVQRDGLEKALQESDTFRNIRIMHSQQDRGGGQRHALRHQPTVGRGMRAVAEAADNGEEESARPPAAAHENL